MRLAILGVAFVGNAFAAAAEMPSATPPPTADTVFESQIGPTAESPLLSSFLSLAIIGDRTNRSRRRHNCIVVHRMKRRDGKLPKHSL